MQKQESIILTALGDIALCGLYSEIIEAKGIQYPFMLIEPELRNSDIVIANLETPFSDRGQATRKKILPLRSNPISIKALASANINLVNLSNNHILDYGEVALVDTMSLLQKEGIGFFGAGTNLLEAQKSFIWKQKNISIAFFGYNHYTTNGHNNATIHKPGVAPLDLKQIEYDIRESVNQGHLVIVSLHWGNEQSNYPTPEQREIAHILVDYGANLILGHHPHVIQGIEEYNNASIVYSLGNFCFPDIYSENIRGFKVHQELSNKESFIFKCHITQTGVSKYEILPIHINDNWQPCISDGDTRQRTLKNIGSYSKELVDADYKSFYSKQISKQQKYYSKIVSIYRKEGINGFWKRINGIYIKAILRGIFTKYRRFFVN